MQPGYTGVADVTSSGAHREDTQRRRRHWVGSDECLDEETQGCLALLALPSVAGCTVKAAGCGYGEGCRV